MNEITITNETSKSVTFNTEFEDKVIKDMYFKKDLIDFLVDSRMNILEMCNADCTDMDEVELDPLTYLSDNLLDVVKEYYHAN